MAPLNRVLLVALGAASLAAVFVAVENDESRQLVRKLLRVRLTPAVVTEYNSTNARAAVPIAAWT
jgi:hypothetical protein